MEEIGVEAQSIEERGSLLFNFIFLVITLDSWHSEKSPTTDVFVLCADKDRFNETTPAALQ